MFFRRRFKIKKSMIPRIYPTSKASLKQMCLMSANGDLEKAQKLYDYMIKDMEDLPLFDPIRPTAIEQVKNGVSDTFSWVKENQDDIFNFVGMIKGFFDKGSGGVPPAAQQSAPLPPIN